MIKTMQETDTEFQALIADVTRTRTGRIDLFTHDAVTSLGNPRQTRAKSTRGILRAIQRAQHRGEMMVTVEVSAEGYTVTTHTGKVGLS